MTFHSSKARPLASKVQQNHCCAVLPQLAQLTVSSSHRCGSALSLRQQRSVRACSFVLLTFALPVVAAATSYIAPSIASDTHMLLQAAEWLSLGPHLRGEGHRCTLWQPTGSRAFCLDVLVMMRNLACCCRAALTREIGRGGNVLVAYNNSLST